MRDSQLNYIKSRPRNKVTDYKNIRDIKEVGIREVLFVCWINDIRDISWNKWRVVHWEWIVRIAVEMVWVLLRGRKLEQVWTMFSGLGVLSATHLRDGPCCEGAADIVRVCRCGWTAYLSWSQRWSIGPAHRSARASQTQTRGWKRGSILTELVYRRYFIAYVIKWNGIQSKFYSTKTDIIRAPWELTPVPLRETSTQEQLILSIANKKADVGNKSRRLNIRPSW